MSGSCSTVVALLALSLLFVLSDAFASSSLTPGIPLTKPIRSSLDHRISGAERGSPLPASWSSTGSVVVDTTWPPSPTAGP
ncbi:hypothetical protein TeGR_g7440 [Tetraparma gracilis]|uniref:Uncharacterized protein n=1 Tax=Tetraparma gracilis TaxID=2962635 RepID=A0ABQ6N6E7_9STRA|nr:hypothetical protein TeGR_g7440 [Tetraparma gracilis]